MTEVTAKRARGRPRSTPSEGKRYSISTNVSADTRTKLELSADRNGQSLAKEADDRIRQSLLDDEALGGGATAHALRTLAGVIWHIEKKHKKSWVEDYYTALAVQTALAQSVSTIFAPNPHQLDEFVLVDLVDRPGFHVPAKISEQVKEHERLREAAVMLGRSVGLGTIVKSKLGKDTSGGA
ncbi:hypothetical protein V6R86_01650 [Sphingomonas kaistensis]|uniref:Uncharacterized protein n=1 Tax=Sphingomonas kaistensis TaxID=298708 RepID=A0ABZ2FYZ4_9SPHN